jgi:hypothetical protein
MKLNRKKIKTVFLAAALTLAGLFWAGESQAKAVADATPVIAVEEQCEDRLTRCWAEERAMEAAIRLCKREVGRCERTSARCGSKLAGCQSKLAACEAAPVEGRGDGRGAVEGQAMRSGLGDILDDLWDTPCHIALEVCVGSRAIKQIELQSCLSDKEDCLDDIDTCEWELEVCQEDLADCREPSTADMGSGRALR